MYVIIVSTIGIFLFSSIVSVYGLHASPKEMLPDYLVASTLQDGRHIASSRQDGALTRDLSLQSVLSVQQQAKDLKFFNVSETSSYTVNVSRRFIFLRWGLVRESTSITIAYEGESGLNALNITIPDYDYAHVNYLDVRYRTGDENSTSERVTLINKIASSGEHVFVVKFPELNKGQNITILISADLVDAFTVKSPGAPHESYPYSFNYTFQPLISLPINDLRVTFEAGDAPSFEFDNTTLTPANLPWKQETAFLEFENITTYDFVKDYVDALKTEGYNMTELKDYDFIPAYTSTLNDSLKDEIKSLFLSFDATHKDAPLIQYDSYSVVVDINEWGRTTITEKIVIRHIGTNTTGANLDLGTLNYETHSLFVPSINATYLRGRDDMGNLTVEVVKLYSLNLTEIRVKPRVPIKFNQTYEFELSYEIPNEVIVERVRGDTLRYKGFIGSYINWTVLNYDLTMVFPIGAGVNANNITRSLIDSVTTPFIDKTITSQETTVKGFLGFINNRYALKFSAHNITSGYAVKFNVYFTYPVWNYLFSTIPWITLGFLLVALYVALRIIDYGRLFKGVRMPEVTEEEIPIDHIKEFVERYQDITVLRRRLA